MVGDLAQVAVEVTAEDVAQQRAQVTPEFAAQRVHILDPIPPSLPRSQARALIQQRIESACDRLIAEARAAPNPPPLPAEGASPAAVARS